MIWSILIVIIVAFLIYAVSKVMVCSGERLRLQTQGGVVFMSHTSVISDTVAVIKAWQENSLLSFPELLLEALKNGFPEG